MQTEVLLPLSGLCEQELITIFNDLELELLISGLPEIDVGDLRANTEYSGYTAASRVVQWFWECVDEMGKQDRALLVQFVTGTSKVPLDGFRGLQVRHSLPSLPPASPLAVSLALSSHIFCSPLPLCCAPCCSLGRGPACRTPVHIMRLFSCSLCCGLIGSSRFCKEGMAPADCMMGMIWCPALRWGEKLRPQRLGLKKASL